MVDEKDKLTRTGKVTLPGLHRRIASPKAEVNPEGMPNRIGLLLDISGSMNSHANGKPKIQHLKDAIQGFLQCVNFTDTSCAIECFEARDTKYRVPLTRLSPQLMLMAMSLETTCSTPMGEAMSYALEHYPITRAVLVSDGSPTDGDASIQQAERYAKAEIPVDCVHIGETSSGEAHLQKIAEITGGVFIKFADVASFGRSFKYLSPAFYGQLTSGNISAEELGAKEVK